MSLVLCEEQKNENILDESNSVLRTEKNKIFWMSVILCEEQKKENILNECNSV